MPGYNEMTEEDKAKYTAKFEALIAEGSTDEEAIAVLQQPQLLVKVIKVEELMIEIELAVAEGKTPLVVDSSESDIVNKFFTYQTVALLDGKKMGLDKSMKKIPVPDIMEEARSKLVFAIKTGIPFVIAMTKSVTDFVETFNDTIAKENHELGGEGAFLPIEMFDKAGKTLLADEKMEALFREKDREDIAGVAVSKNPDGFYVVLTTQFTEEDYEDYLFGNNWGLPKPKDKYKALLVRAS